MKTLLLAAGICLSAAVGMTPLLKNSRGDGAADRPPVLGAHARAVFADPLRASTLSCHGGTCGGTGEPRDPGCRAPDPPDKSVCVYGRGDEVWFR